MFHKLAVLTAITLVSFAAVASDYTYNCKQRTDRSPVNPSVGALSISIKHVKTIGSSTEYRGEYWDSIDLVKVTVRSLKNGRKSVIRETMATATSEDVMFDINSNGIKFNVYMDELDESDLALMVNGKEVAVSMTCEN